MVTQRFCLANNRSRFSAIVALMDEIANDIAFRADASDGEAGSRESVAAAAAAQPLVAGAPGNGSVEAAVVRGGRGIGVAAVADAGSMVRSRGGPSVRRFFRAGDRDEEGETVHLASSPLSPSPSHSASVMSLSSSSSSSISDLRRRRLVAGLDRETRAGP